MTCNIRTIRVDKVDLLTKLFRGFADNSRLSILEHLKTGELTVNQLVERTGLSQPNVSNHLSCLKECGLVRSEQRARFVFYRLGSIKVRKLLVAVRELLADVLPEIERCANYETSIRQIKARMARKVTT